MDDTIITVIATLGTSSKEAQITVKAPKCRVEFDANKDDIKKGSFGFDSFSDSKTGCTNKNQLKSEYHRYEDIGKEEYLVPWVSMRKGQTITLKVNSKIVGKYEKIELADSNFTFEPNLITQETKQIKITCQAELSSNTLVEVQADGKVAGAIHFCSNKPKKVKLKWVVVGLNGDGEAISNIINDESILNAYFKKAFTPSIIDIVIENKDTDELDIPYKQYQKYIEAKEKVKDRNTTPPDPTFTVDPHIEAFVKTTMECFDSADTLKYDNKAKLRFIQKLYTLYVSKRQTTPNTLYLFLTNLKCGFEKDGNESFNNGVSIDKISLMFLGNSKKTPDTEIPHEVMHLLGLGHPFAEDGKAPPKHEYIAKSTKNYMDYNNTKLTTWKWQWEIMRQSDLTYE